MPTKTPIRLSDFILSNMETILQAWEDFARTIEPPALTMDDTELRDHAKLMLTTIAEDLKTPKSSHEQAEKSKGKGRRRKSDTAAEIHAKARLLSGYSVEQLVSEYRALRTSVLDLWIAETQQTQGTDLEDSMRFNQAIDQALAESVGRYAAMVKQSENMFLAILGHDLRNPLGTIVTGANFLMRANDIPSKYVLAATRMYNSGQRMSKLIADLIDFTRTHLGAGIPIKLKRMNLTEVCMNVVDELRTSHPERIIDFSSFNREDLFGDDSRLAQVLSNLIGNALQYGVPDQPITVRIASTEEDVTVTVNNNGPVIPPNKLGAVFDPLVRLSDKEHGNDVRETSLGIGMFIAREIVNAHKGSIGVESHEAEGTTFRVTLLRHPPPGLSTDDHQ